jgi:hypothetical protein
MITLLRWRKTKNNGKSGDTDAKVGNCIRVALATPIELNTFIFH